MQKQENQCRQAVEFAQQQLQPDLPFVTILAVATVGNNRAKPTPLGSGTGLRRLS